MSEIKRINAAQARKIIRQLNRMDLDKADYPYIKGEIQHLITGLRMKFITPHKETRLYRGVIYRDKPTDVKFLRYPPKQLVVDFQRCNPPEQPMFYCSPDPAAIYYELGVRPGDIVYLSKWSVLEDFFVNRIAPLDAEGEDEDDLIKEIIFTFFETKFSQPIHETYSSQYKITSAISEKISSGDLLGDHRILGGLTYPSVSHPNRSENLAIWPAVVDRCLRLDYVEEVLITAVEDKKISINRTDFSATFDEGLIGWTGGVMRWTVDSGAAITFTAEYDEWVARDQYGNIVNPG